ncbi:MAG: GNAT family N-acetyltransferase [Firmicutes bacterium]|nr:GNAT family N-acetyltransferase [Bacillota bacterium]
MNIEIKKLTVEWLNDYLAFFDHEAFSDNGEWDGCYCTYYHFGHVEAESYENDPKRKPKLRQKAIEMITKGRLQGYLAYADGRVVGWVNVGPKKEYAAINDAPELQSKEDAHIKSVVCFIIAPTMRHQGIATMLLKQAIEDAKKEGFFFVESYPNITTGNCYVNYHGYRTMFERLGFTVHQTLTKLLIMRIKL